MIAVKVTKVAPVLRISYVNLQDKYREAARNAGKKEEPSFERVFNQVMQERVNVTR